MKTFNEWLESVMDQKLGKYDLNNSGFDLWPELANKFQEPVLKAIIDGGVTIQQDPKGGFVIANRNSPQEYRVFQPGDVSKAWEYVLNLNRYYGLSQFRPWGEKGEKFWGDTQN